MDVHNACLVVAVLSLSVSGVVVWLAFAREGLDNETIRHERTIRSILRDIQASQTQTQNTSDLVPSTLDGFWPGLHRNLANYFTRGYFSHSQKYHKEYTHSPLSILPFFHDEGGEFESCLKQTAVAQKQAVSPELNLGNRLMWDSTSEGLFRFKHKFKLHYGRASFMACDWSQGDTAGEPSQCGHAFIMQDPIMMAIADLGKCLLDPRGQPLCQRILQNKASVEEWIAARGNVVFKHILFHSEICHSSYSQRQTEPQHESQPHHPQPNHMDSSLLCEKNHDMFINSLQPETVNQFVNFITRNIHKLFSVVGIFEDLSKSLTLLNRVFRLPLHECEFLTRFSETSSTAKPKYIHRMKHKASKDTSPNKIRFDLVQNFGYKKIASLLGFNTDNEDSFSLLDALKHIENTLTRSHETLRKHSNLNSNISENNEHLDFTFDYDILDVNTSNSQDSFDVNTNVDVNTSLDVDTDVNVYTSMDTNKSDLSMDTVRNPNTSKTSQNTVPYYKEVPGNVQDEDNEEDWGDDSEKDLTLDSALLLHQARELEGDVVRERLYKILKENQQITKLLSPDLRIYKAVKHLYSLQTRLLFNSFKNV